MNLNEQMHHLGQIGTDTYQASDATVEQLLNRAKRARAIRQGSTAAITSVGALALGVVAVQAVNAAREDAASRDRNLVESINRLPSLESFKQQYGNNQKAIEEYDITPIIEKLEVAAQEAAALKELEAKKKAEADAAAKKAAEEAAAKKKAEAEAAKPKPKPSTSTPTCTAKPYDTYVEYYEKCHEGVLYKKAKPGYVEHNGFRAITSWTDAATGSSYWGAYSNNKLVITPNSTDGWWFGYYYPESFTGNTCQGKTKVVEGNIHQESCYPGGGWHDKGPA